ncbi:MAG: glycosyltransferase family 4 protein [Thermoanaerobaculia bacterium]
MKILLLCTDAYGGHGGIALFNRQLISALATHPHSEEIVVVPRVIVHDLEPQPPTVTFLSEAARSKSRYVSTVLATARRTRFDIILCGHVNLLPLARSLGQAPVLVIHGIEAWKRHRVVEMLAHGVRAVLAVSELTRDRFVNWSHYHGPSFVLPNAVRPELYGVREKRADLISRYGLAGKRVLLTLGRIAREERSKGFDEVLEILPSLLATDPDLVYMIAGRGNDVARLEEKARALGVRSRVVFTGFVAEAEKADLYNLADVYVMPSRGEGFGFVLLEAMACGVPVIGSRHDGGREALAHGALGLLVDPSNPAELRDAVREALRNRTRTIPPGMDAFAYEAFEQRVHHIVEALQHRSLETDPHILA